MEIANTQYIFIILGLIFACYSVVANDSVQTLGTFIESNRKVKWYYLYGFIASIFVATIAYGYFTGDMSYGRLNKIPEQPIQWYHVLAPLTLVILTRIGIPVSTSFLVLSVFASNIVLQKMFMKSAVGYALAAAFAYFLWIGITYSFKDKKIKKSEHLKWSVLQWLSTGWLWFTWLTHDIANITVFLPRNPSIYWATFLVVLILGFLGIIFYERGGKIQKIIAEKTDVSYIKAATIVDLAYAFILWFFKELNDIPMSTTWVFVGLLAGREFGINTIRKTKKIKNVFPMVGRDFLKMTIGVTVSLALVFVINHLLKSAP
jgi:hypothetical protein